ncbi:nutrient deprivation-induced protein [Arsenicitalea aurantiaca]|uniref:Nutrient deprivation-induced protein n=1 Tax=Arsenicitalea aurantiaca TaxID=1783274 RepID=A0A433X3H1_9HYPH|nr:nutrient deprivation-induced protein [Arsenicitalea aurantiaca]RUT28615.1 nutrient deprivation-induced protein [Arsenicitalea aurantiaca]
MSTDNPTGGGSPVRTTGLPPEAELQVRKDIDAVTKTAKEDFNALRHEAEERVDELRHEAERQIEKAKDQAHTFAGKQKDFAAEQVGSVAMALSKVADELETGEDAQNATVAGYARTLSHSLEKVSGTLKDNEVDDVVGMAEDFGRREPAAFLGVAALAGFAASRFLTASAHRRSSQRTGGTTSTSPSTQPNTTGTYSSGAGGYGTPGTNTGSGRIS